MTYAKVGRNTAKTLAGREPPSDYRQGFSEAILLPMEQGNRFINRKVPLAHVASFPIGVVTANISTVL